jgi:hypothetical protein
MSQAIRRKRAPEKTRGSAGAAGKPAKAPSQKQRDSDDIERAVYDGMQDLRTERPKSR